MSRPSFTRFAQHYWATLLAEFGTVYLDEPVPRAPTLRVHKYPSRSNFGTTVLETLTANQPSVWVSPEIVAEAELVDVLFEPNLEQSRTALGLLGALITAPCIIETLRSIPTTRNFRKCFGNGLRWQVESDGGILPIDAMSGDDSMIEDSSEDETEELEKQLIVVVPSMTEKQLAGWGAEPNHRNVAGLYELAPIWCTTIVLTRELPPTAETLWLRLLSRGAAQRAAIQELMQLDSSHPFRDVVLRSLQHWYQQMGREQTGRESLETMRLLSQIEI
ncbi:hypothetical protein [Leptolyngbya sp. NIES-2104]|uniref:hypothetical protein n=1 Tax=Leptolyngbya sp. NIES-2104 TaxID=1552121 RepID=UPI0006EC8362|nr:hypothetical protein [Leptolyngbya sp. NIES-2104]GAP99952.1 hypothetical protein NIES2104_65180 [Leptolyngbya sp. NIES-2104]